MTNSNSGSLSEPQWLRRLESAQVQGAGGAAAGAGGAATGPLPPPAAGCIWMSSIAPESFPQRATSGGLPTGGRAQGTPRTGAAAEGSRRATPIDSC